jgi:5'-nucleotidase
MHILVTNDDGVEAPGIAALAEVAAGFGRVTVIAPSQGVSSCGHHVTTHHDLTVKQLREGWYSVDGYPADCVRVGLTAIVKDTTLVLSGINDGGNLGMDLLMSGTASAAREATIRGIPGIALSQYKARRGDADWPRAIEWARNTLNEVIKRAPPKGAFWNLNLPDPQGEQSQPELVECQYDFEPLPVGFEYAEGTWRYSSQYQSRLRTPDRDVALCFGGAITLSAVPAFH